MAEFRVIEEAAGFRWELLDENLILGVAALPRKSVGLALVDAALLKAVSTEIKVDVHKVEAGFQWSASSGVAVAVAQAPLDSRRAARAAARRFVSALPDSELPSLPEKPELGFDVEEVPGDPARRLFRGRSHPAPMMWHWDFGDGATAEGATVEHGYTRSGTYQIALCVKDAGGGERHAATQLIISIASPVTPAEPDGPEIVVPPLSRTGVTRMHDAVSFLHCGPNAPQKTMRAAALKPHRIAVIRGTVRGRGGAQEAGVPLAGVRVSVRQQPEMGFVETRGSGGFDLVVNGGATLTLIFEKEGYLTCRRRLEVPWQEYVAAAPVLMTRRGSVAGRIDFRVDAAFHLITGEETMADDAPRRQPVLLIAGGTQASDPMLDGAPPLSDAALTLLEFTAGLEAAAAMPAELPPNSALTYAVDLSAEGAENLQFDQPLYYYVDNFLDFPVGTPVPAGRFDPGRDCWVAEKNGIVIKLLGVDEGVARLDVTGDGKAADDGLLEDLGVTEAERRQLASLYESGKSLWRVPISHFSAWDFNWPYGPPPGAERPNLPRPRGNDSAPQEGAPPPRVKCQSTIDVDSQALGETLRPPNLPYGLCYSSRRAPGRRSAYSTSITLSGEKLPQPLKRIQLKISIAGRETERSYEPAPGQTDSYTWDGRDAYQRPVHGRQPVRIGVGYTYGAVYQAPSEHERSFGEYSGSATQNQARQEITLWQEWSDALGVWDARASGLGGWTLDVHHSYDPIGRVLFRGDGGERFVAAGIAEAEISLIPQGTESSTGPSLPSCSPSAVAVDEEGLVYVSDTAGRKVYRIWPDGKVELFAAFGEGAVVEANLHNPHGLAVGPEGNVYLCDHYDHCIYRFTRDGKAAIIAGSMGRKGFAGDGGPASKSLLKNPTELPFPGTEWSTLPTAATTASARSA
jgi:PKD repeat protein